MTSKPETKPTGDGEDQALETAIAEAYLALAVGRGPQQRRRAWQRLRRLVDQRGARQVARMERERGLR